MAKFGVAIQKPLERLLVELCEHLPGNMTLLEREGLCSKPTDNCRYCRQVDTSNYLCCKKTYTPLAGQAEHMTSI